MTEKTWIEKIADVRPDVFLLWFLEKIADNIEMPDHLEDWFVLYFREAGVDKHADVFGIGDYDGYFNLHAGVQLVQRKPPEWVALFADVIGYKPKESHWLVIARVLLRACQSDSFDLGMAFFDHSS